MHKLLDTNKYYDRLGDYFIKNDLDSPGNGTPTFFENFHTWVYNEHGARIQFNDDANFEFWFETKDAMLEFVLRWSDD